jgi:hypothetical protein
VEVKIKWASLNSSEIPMDKKNTEEDLKEFAKGVASKLEKERGETLGLDLKLLHPLGIFSGRILEGIAENIKGYGVRWAGKLFSGDVSSAIGETITYAVLDTKFKVDVSSLVPFRLVKYLGIVPDLVIPLAEYEELKDFLRAKGNELLLVNSRSMVRFSLSTLVSNLVKDLSVTEVLRYPDNFSLLSYVTYNEGIKDLMVVVRP